MSPFNPNPKFLQYFDDKYRVLHHILFWMFYFLDRIPDFFDNSNTLLEVVTFFAIDVIMIYVNLYVLLPKYLLKRKLSKYFLLSLATIAVNVVFSIWACDYLFNTGWKSEKLSKLTVFLYRSAFNFQNIAFFMGTAVGLKLFKIWLKNQRKIQNLENEKLKAELRYLKSQINPHFLFNTLNNIYVLIKINTEKASKIILKLSDLLRYQLYDCSKEKVKLTSEIDYLKNYLELEKIRRDNANIAFEVNGVVHGIYIQPFLFISFVENAVKYGLNNDNNSFIKAVLSVSKGKKIFFTIKNSKNGTNTVSKHSGIGLTNIKRRLQLLYPHKHSLNIKETTGVYSVELMIDLM